MVPNLIEIKLQSAHGCSISLALYATVAQNMSPVQDWGKLDTKMTSFVSSW